MNEEELEDFGAYLRAQREIARLSLRHLARMTNVSDSYLSQLERGLYQPSPEVLQAIAQGLGLSPESLYRRLGWLPSNDDEPAPPGVIEAIMADTRLSATKKTALINMYRTLVEDA
jgi:transcriptional regulator with XRE-family HTH domain